jgi:hypothetical protein
MFWADARLPFKENQLGVRALAHLLASVPLALLYFHLVVAVSVFLGLEKWSAWPSRSHAIHPRSSIVHR